MQPRLRRLVLAAFALVASVAAAPAATIDFNGFYVLGDSLSDVGNTSSLTRGQAPESPPYDRLRFSNGRIWYDRVAAAVRADGGRARNFAYGGAHASENFDPIPDLRNQRRRLLDRIDPGRKDLAVIWIGGNDLLGEVGSSKISGVARKAADEVYSAARSLQAGGFKTAMIFNMPNLADIPRYVGASRADRRSARRGTDVYNARLADRVKALRSRGLKVIDVDTFGIFADVIANPSDYGLKNLTKPCIRGGRDRCSAAQARVTAFADEIHPSEALHAILGRRVLDLIDSPSAAASRLDAPLAAASVQRSSASVTAVPLPTPALLLLTAIAGLCITSRLRRSREDSDVKSMT